MKKVIIMGSTGMIGQIVLRHCLDSPDIGEVITLVRRPSGMEHPKLNEMIHDNYLDYHNLDKAFAGVDIACFCIGVGSV